MQFRASINRCGLICYGGDIRVKLNALLLAVLHWNRISGDATALDLRARDSDSARRGVLFRVGFTTQRLIKVGQRRN